MVRPDKKKKINNNKYINAGDEIARNPKFQLTSESQKLYCASGTVSAIEESNWEAEDGIGLTV